MAQALKGIQKEVIQSRVKTWETKQKAKVDNKADKMIAINEEKKNASEIDLEALGKKIETKVEKLRHEELEKMKNKEAHSIKVTEDTKVKIEAKRTYGLQKVEKKAEKFRGSNSLPTKCFGVCVDE
ncbi:hypothetical protein ACE6H2_009001 [Prunus campanulata]